MKTNTASTIVLTLVALLAGESVIVRAGEQASYFRADRGRAANDSQPLPESLDDSELVWRVTLAQGHSTPCVVGDTIFVTIVEDEKLATVALDRATGAERWRQIAPAERKEPHHRSGSPATATPASDGERVITFFGSYGLLCYDMTGNLLWSKPLGPFQDEFGSGSSPVLVGNRVLLNEDHDIDNFLLCVDATTGKTLWQTPRPGFTRSYATPVIWETEGKTQVIVAGALQLMSYDLETGEPLWSLDGFARIVNTTPTLENDLLLVSTWSPGGDSDSRIAMETWDEACKQWDKDSNGKLSREECNNPDVIDRFFRIDLNQDQGLDQQEWEKYASVFERARNVLQAIKLKQSGRKFEPEVVWTYDKGLPYVSSPLIYRGIVYLSKDGGILTTLDARDGTLLKQGRVRGTGTYFASPVAGDGKVYVASDRGVVTVLAAGGDQDAINSRDFGERIVATPVIADGRICLRTEAALYCFARK